MEFSIYVLDTETTGTIPTEHDVIEVSIYRLNDDQQKTWYLKPLNYASISKDALRVNGHKLEDLKLETKDGREKYKDPNKVLVEIENWLAEDGVSADERIFVAHNAAFDREMLKQLWIKCKSEGTFPFNERYYLDTMQIEFFLELCKREFGDGYSLKLLCRKYGIKNENAHTADADTKALVGVFKKQIEFFQKLLVK